MAERRYTLVLYGALIVAGVATYGAYSLINSARAQGQVRTQLVVVATKDVPEGAMFDRVDVTTRAWPAAAVPVGAYRSIDSVVGRVARIAVFEGEPVVPGRLAPTGAAAGLETKIPPGMRAMAVRINDVAGISGLLQPNSRVDVLVTLVEGNNAEQQVAKLFMENMRVLSVGTEVQRDKDGKPINAATVTLGVTPEEAERLAVAMSRGSIQLVLRGYGDPDTIRTHGATSHDVLAQLRGIPTPVPVTEPHPAPRPIKRVVRVVVPVAPPPPATPTVVMRTPTPSDSLRIDVYRGDKATRQSFEKLGGSATSSVP